MTKKDLIQFCKYYKGENDNPFLGKDQMKSLLWDYERSWIDYNFSDKGRDTLADFVSDYASVGLSLFEVHDDIPVSLKATLFNRYCYWSSGTMIDCVIPFKKFYKQYY